MSQISLQNKDTRVLKAGDYVKFAPNTRTGCVFALIGDANIIGTCAEQMALGKWGLINLLNTVSWTDISGKPNLVTDISGKVDKETGKSLVSNSDITKLSSTPIITVSATEPSNPVVGQIWIDIS